MNYSLSMYPVVSLRRDVHHNVPVKQKGVAPYPTGRPERHKRPQSAAAMLNSTLQHHCTSSEVKPYLNCELSAIDLTVSTQKQVPDTPAKVFARLKAKVQQQNLEERPEDAILPTGTNNESSFHPDAPRLSSDASLQNGQDTYVLTLSPPESPRTNSESGDPVPMSHANGEKAGSRTGSGYEPVVFLQRLSLEHVPQIRNLNKGLVFAEKSIRKDTDEDEEAEESDAPRRLCAAARGQSVSQRLTNLTGRHVEGLQAPVQAIPNLMEDSLLQRSPRITIPQKQKSRVKSTHKVKELDESQEETDVDGIRLKDWVLKLYNKELIVDGVRLDNKIPWHSSCITERVSKKAVQTASGQIYTLVGNMSHYHNSPFPSWFQKKFLFGFPETWREHLKTFLSDTKPPGVGQKSNDTAASQAQKGRNTKKQDAKRSKSKDPVTPASFRIATHPGGAPVSRSGRLIKPPLQYWKGGRITLDSDLNVTVHEDYTSNTTLITPKTALVISKSPKKKKNQTAASRTSEEMQNSSDDDMSAPNRRVKQWHRSSRALIKTPQKESQLSCSSSGADPETAEKRPSDQHEQSERTFLRRGRSYSRDRNSSLSSASLSEPSRIGVCSTASPVDPHGAEGLQTKRKHLKSGQLKETNASLSLTRSRVHKSLDSDHVFTPPDPPKRDRKKATPPPPPIKPSLPKSATPESSTEDSDFCPERDQGRAKRISHRHRKVPQKYHVDQVSKPKPKSRPKKTSSASESPANEPTSPDEPHPEQTKPTDDHQRSPCSVREKAAQKQSTRRKKSNRHDATLTEVEQEMFSELVWTDEELQKLTTAVISLPKHKSSYWINVALFVGTRSAEECQKRYTELYQTRARPRGKKKEKTPKINDPGKEAVAITAKVGTLKRKKQMWEFLDHIPKDDHDDVFTGSPMRTKQIKLPVWSPSGDEPNFGNLQNPQTPSSSLFPSVKTPKCLHITPGMMRSFNRENNDKYIYQLQKVKKGNRARKCSQKDKVTPVPPVQKNKKRCVAEDDNFVVWNMLSDKDVPLTKDEEEDEEEDDYFMDEY